MMKTLDEVIKALEVCTSGYCSNHDGDCPYLEHYDCDDEQMNRDALHYLKEYRMMMDDIAEKRETLEEKISHYCDLIKIETDHYARSKVRWAEEYKNIKDDYEALQDFWAESQANPPLTWDELKQMEGKPVWVEESAENGLWWTYWVIWDGDNAVLPKNDYSTKWKAYRKERK